MQKPDTWKRTSSKQIADCRVFKVRQDHCIRENDGDSADFFVLEIRDWVNVIGLNKANELILIEQFRQGTGEVNLELPGGIIDDGESAEATAIRELSEETGYTSERWKILGKSRPNPALQNNTIYHYLAQDCEKTEETSFDEHESILTRTVPMEEVKELIRQGQMDHSLAVAAFYYLFASSTE